jgi:hypothetical protein
MPHRMTKQLPAEVPIPADKVALVQGKACEAWIVEHCAGSVIGHNAGGGYALLFSDAGEAAAFSARWLSEGNYILE